VFINIAAARTGAPQTPQDRDRAKAIDELVTTKVREQKLICLGAGQHWEFYDEEHVRDAFDMMTLGAGLSATSMVQRRQLGSAMKAYLDGMHEIVLPLGTFFRRLFARSRSSGGGFRAIVRALRPSGSPRSRRETFPCAAGAWHGRGQVCYAW